MSLDKAIEHKKEHRKPYFGEKAFDTSCRNHGDDDWSTSDRLHSRWRDEAMAKDKIRDWELSRF